MSSGRTVSVTTKATSNPLGLSDLSANVQGAEATSDRWAINVINTDSANTILVGRTGIAVIPLGPGQAYRFEGCAYRDITANGQGNAVVMAVDMSDTIQERFAAMHPLKPVIGTIGGR